MAQRRGWIWLSAGVLLALIAGLLTFRTVNEATQSATLSRLEDVPTIQVLVAAQNIPPRRLLDESMVKLQQIPATLVPEGYLRSTAEVLTKFSDTPLVAGEILLQHRLLSPTDANAPVIYRISPDQVLIAIPATAMLGQVGMLAVGNRLDIAYTVAIDFNQSEEEKPEESPVTTFLSLQNLEVKALLRRQPPTDEGSAMLRPDAILLAVSPQDALVLKHLIDTGAPMDFFLRAPGNEALSPVLPVDARYLIDRFQLQIPPGGEIAAGSGSAASATPGDEFNFTLNTVQQNAADDEALDADQGEQ
ncbi:MAG: Flp pilus assembly protein CpaB [Caldilineaceae bacterium]|nr:Flp pilus assembly protein CpaB [Caldilineaceae bacterium]